MIHVLIGTQAECIKVAPVLQELARRGIPYNLVQSGQHPARLAAALELFELPPPATTLAAGPEVTTLAGAARWLLQVARRAASAGRLRREIFRGARGICLVHGDTVSAVLGTVLARRAGLKVAHLEGGLRSFDYLHPFPEELCRTVTSRLATLLFAPGEWAAHNLRSLRRGRRVVTLPANSVHDALGYILARNPLRPAGIEPPYAVASIHRFETIYSRRRLALVCRVLRQAARQQPLVLALHEVTLGRLRRYGLFEQLERGDIVRLPFLGYDRFVALLRDARFVVADGGSIQEEAFYLDLPALILRRRTERIEGLGSNVCLGGFAPRATARFLADPERFRRGERSRLPAVAPLVVDELLRHA